jgi:hypothetical protein
VLNPTNRFAVRTAASTIGVENSWMLTEYPSDRVEFVEYV